MKWISVGARASPLSRAQVDEVLDELRKFHPQIGFKTQFIQTTGDRDLTTSLRDLGKSDFFTKELDRLVLEKKCQIAIHSAKDLPEPLPEGLFLCALTKGLTSSDALVLRDNESLFPGAKIGCSCKRRELAVACLHDRLTFVDIRGTIEARLQKLQTRELDGVVVAECALIRLKLLSLRGCCKNCFPSRKMRFSKEFKIIRGSQYRDEHIGDEDCFKVTEKISFLEGNEFLQYPLNRILLPGPTALHQGRLAVVTRSEDEEMKKLFNTLNDEALPRH